MKTATQPRRRARNATTGATDNQYIALISDLDSDSDLDTDSDDSDSETKSVHSIAGLSDTDSEFSAVNHQVYQAAVLEDQRIFEENQLRYIQEEDSDDDSYDDKATMIITPDALKALCSPFLTPLKEWNTNQVQHVKYPSSTVSFVSHLRHMTTDMDMWWRLKTISDNEWETPKLHCLRHLSVLRNH